MIPLMPTSSRQVQSAAAHTDCRHAQDQCGCNIQHGLASPMGHKADTPVVAVQGVFEASLAELLRPDGFVLLGLTCIAGLLDAALIRQSRHQELCDQVRSVSSSACLAAEAWHSMDANAACYAGSDLLLCSLKHGDDVV